MKFEGEFFRRLEARLAQEAPGASAQLIMAPKPRPGQVPFAEGDRTSAKAAVLILLYPRDGEVAFVLVRRTQTVMHHRDQIGLPGGQVERGETPEETALRETREELGVSPDIVRVLGRLTPLYIQVSNFSVTPVVGVAAETPAFVPDPIETAEVIEMPLEHLLDAANVRMEDWVIRDLPVVVPFYSFGRHKVWGATAMILAEFVEVLKSLASNT